MAFAPAHANADLALSLRHDTSTPYVPIAASISATARRFEEQRQESLPAHESPNTRPSSEAAAGRPGSIVRTASESTERRLDGPRERTTKLNDVDEKLIAVPAELKYLGADLLVQSP